MPITEEFVKHLMEQNAAMAGQISQLTKTVESLNQTIQKLQEQLNKNSKNSSKPPSSDGFKKPPVNKDRSLRQPSGKKQGGQEGHEGKYLSITVTPDQAEKHMHSACSGLPRRVPSHELLRFARNSKTVSWQAFSLISHFHFPLQ